MDPRCPLCRTDGGDVVWRCASHRVVLVDEPALSGYCRVIWNAHVAELTDISAGERAALTRTVEQVERAIRATIAPDKINVASLGNVVPHLHVHVVPRWWDDPWFPGPVWTAPMRAMSSRADGAELVARLRDALQTRLPSREDGS